MFIELSSPYFVRTYVCTDIGAERSEPKSIRRFKNYGTFVEPATDAEHVLYIRCLTMKIGKIVDGATDNTDENKINISIPIVICHTINMHRYPDLH